MLFNSPLLFVFSTLLTMAHSAPVELYPRTFSGDATFFVPGLGACGFTNTADQLIVAVGHGEFDSFPGAGPNPNTNPICGKQIQATSGGRTVTATVVDRCAGCAGAADLDFSEAAFAQLADPSVGRIHGVQWDFI